MDASTQGWGCSLLHHTMDGLWSEEESALHSNLLELQAVWLALFQFQHFSRARQWGCLQTTPQLWHTFRIKGALIRRLSKTKLSGRCVGRRAGLFLSALNSSVDHATWGGFYQPEVSVPFHRGDFPSQGLSGPVVTMGYVSH